MTTTPGEQNLACAVWLSLYSVLFLRTVWLARTVAPLLSRILLGGTGTRSIHLNRMATRWIPAMSQKHTDELFTIMTWEKGKNPLSQKRVERSFALHVTTSGTSSSVTTDDDDNLVYYANVPVSVVEALFAGGASEEQHQQKHYFFLWTTTTFKLFKLILFSHPCSWKASTAAAASQSNYWSSSDENNNRYCRLGPGWAGQPECETSLERIRKVLRPFAMINACAGGPGGITLTPPPAPQPGAGGRKKVALVVVVPKPTAAAADLTQISLVDNTGGRYTARDSFVLSHQLVRKGAPVPSFNEVPGIYGFDGSSPTPVECMICCDAVANTVLINCCHCSTCETCTSSLRDLKCPICRNAITETIILPLTERLVISSPRTASTNIQMLD